MLGLGCTTNSEGRILVAPWRDLARHMDKDHTETVSASTSSMLSEIGSSTNHT